MSARVLIVDDNESLRRVFSALLTQAGYQVLAALPDGSKLVEWMRRETPDIVCLDYHLPGRDGLSLLAFRGQGPDHGRRPGCGISRDR